VISIRVHWKWKRTKQGRLSNVYFAENWTKHKILSNGDKLATAFACCLGSPDMTFFNLYRYIINAGGVFGL